jgi:hypothetical protein
MSDTNSTPDSPSRVPNGFAYRVPWHATTPGDLHEELARECCEEHCLFGVTARVVAHRQDCDDFLFELFGARAPGEFAVVHLVFGGRRETNPNWPETRVFPTFQAWVTHCMQPDADDWDLTESTLQ